MVKKCTVCGIFISGRASQAAKTCSRLCSQIQRDAYRRDYWKKNKDRLRIHLKLYYEENRTLIRQTVQEKRLANIIDERRKDREWRQKNKDRINEQRRIKRVVKNAALTQEDLERRRAYFRDYYAKNRERLNEITREKSRERRAVLTALREMGFFSESEREMRA